MDSNGILIVDDDPVFLILLRKCFMQWGLGVDCAENGGDALHLMEEKTFALLLTDLQMPGMNGLELARKAREVVPTLHIVLCTGAVTPDVREQAEKTGISQVVPKPVRFGELQAIVGELVGRHRAGNHADVLPSSAVDGIANPQLNPPENKTFANH